MNLTPDKERTGVAPVSRPVVALLIFCLLLFAAPFILTQTPTKTENFSEQNSDTANPSEADWNKVASIAQKFGCTVEPFDASAPATMRVRVPASVAYTISEREAKDMGYAIVQHLGKRGVVYIRTPAQQTIARVYAWEGR